MGSFPSGGSKPTFGGHEATLHDLLSGSGYLEGQDCLYSSSHCGHGEWLDQEQTSPTALKLGKPSRGTGQGCSDITQDRRRTSLGSDLSGLGLLRHQMSGAGSERLFKPSVLAYGQGWVPQGLSV